MRTLLVLLALANPAAAQTLPHQWLFGTWTGGLFPVEPGNLAQACRTPTVIFAKDAVGHASLIDPAFTERVIETVRSDATGAEFRFTAAPSQAPGVGTVAIDAGFGCETPDVLHVARGTDGAISFPGCAAFPNPLLHCR